MKIRWFAALFLLLGCAAAPALRTASEKALENMPAGSAEGFFYASAGIQAEAYMVRPRGTGPFPLIVFLHGHSLRGSGGQRLVPAAEIFAREICYAGLAISLPGYGETPRGDGPLEEITRAVVLDAVAEAKRIPWVDTEQIYLYGFSRGAAVAAAVADEIGGVQGVMLHSGVYDLDRLYRETTSFWLRVMLNPGGEDQPRFRDLLARIGDWRFSTLVLHGEQDSLVPLSQALLLRDRLAQLGKKHRLVTFPDRGHRLTIADIKTQALRFLLETGGSACPVNDP